MRVVARPSSPLTFDYRMLVEGRERGRVVHRAFGRPGGMRVDGVDHTIRRNGPFAWTAAIAGVPGEVLGATRVGRLRGRTQLTWSGGSIVMKRAGWGSRTDLLVGDAVVGRIRPRNLLTRTLIADLPDEVPLAAVGMCFWLMMRARRAAMTSTA